jgi:AraC-like DNA-binding protein
VLDRHWTNILIVGFSSDHISLIALLFGYESESAFSTAFK